MTEFIPLQVPAPLYEKAVRWLANEMVGSNGQLDNQTATGRPRAAAMPKVPWTVDELRRLNGELEDRPAVKALLGLLRERDGAAVRIEDYSEITHIDNRKLAAGLAGFTQLCAREFRRSNWPFRVDYPDSNQGHAVYSMIPELVGLWRQI